MVRSMRRRTRKSKRGKRSTAQAVRSDQLVNRNILEQLRVGPGNPIPEVRDVLPMRISRKKTYTISRSCSRGSLTVGVAPTFGALAFTLADLPSYTEFTALFDQYRFERVVVKFIPASALSTTNAYHIPPLFTVIDYDDANLPGSVNELRQYQTLMVVPPCAPHVRTLTPRLAIGAYSGAFTSFAQARSWCDSASPAVQWYGLKYSVDSSSSSDVLYYLEAEYTIAFRNTR